MLRVKDFTWHPGYMELNEAVLDEPMRAEVKLRRVKRHYHERAYGYEIKGPSGKSLGPPPKKARCPVEWCRWSLKGSRLRVRAVFLLADVRQ